VKIYEIRYERWKCFKGIKDESEWKKGLPTKLLRESSIRRPLFCPLKFPRLMHIGNIYGPPPSQPQIIFLINFHPANA
jgi:hypothetical protein